MLNRSPLKFQNMIHRIGLHRALLIISFPLILSFMVSCGSDMQNGQMLSENTNSLKKDAEEPWIYDGISELRKGDIIVRPNVNLLPGTAIIEGGWSFGHAAIVTRAAEHSHPDSLLAASMIFESHSRPLHRIHQLREVPGYLISNDPVLHNDHFGPKYTGGRYRLRLNISDSQIDSIIAFVRSQKGSYSSWNSMKRFQGIPHIEELVREGKRANWADNTHWYCSLLIWQSVLYVTGIDLDPNGAYYAFPNDLITSPYFNNTGEFIGRARF